MPIYPIPGGPGAITARRATARKIFEGANLYFALPGGVLIDGTKSRDSGNTGDLDYLRAGLLMGRITSGLKWAPSILGVMTAAQVATDTSVTVSAAQAVEIVRRVGSSGTLTFTGPPTANGTVVSFTETFSAVNQSTGVITVSALNADLVAGSFVLHNDGTENPRSFVGPGFPLKMTDQDGTSSSSVQWPNLPIGGTLNAADLLYWPTDTSLQAWIIGKLNAAAGGQFIFADYQYRSA